MHTRKKNFSLSVIFILLVNLLFIPSTVQAGDLCGNVVQEVGKKFIKITLTDNGTAFPACISVNENGGTVTFADLQKLGAKHPLWNAIVSKPDTTVKAEAKYCLFPNGSKNPSKDYDAWYEIGLLNKSLSQISIPKITCAIDDPNNAGGQNVYVEYDRDTVPKYPIRYKIEVDDNNRHIYITYDGEELASKNVKTAQENCTLLLRQKRPMCVPPELDLTVKTPLEILEYAKKTASIPVDCQQDIEACILNALPNKDTEAEKQAIKNLHADDPHYQKPAGYVGPLPDCSFTYEGCRNINDLLVMFIKLGKALFQVIGTFAFVMFIYGGFTIIMSMGSPEKVKKGQEALVAAVVGLLISFSAYLIINFVLDALQVSDLFRVIQ